jgi:hypothetical protein
MKQKSNLSKNILLSSWVERDLFFDSLVDGLLDRTFRWSSTLLFAKLEKNCYYCHYFESKASKKYSKLIEKLNKTHDLMIAMKYVMIGRHQRQNPKQYYCDLHMNNFHHENYILLMLKNYSFLFLSIVRHSVLRLFWLAVFENKTVTEFSKAFEILKFSICDKYR